MVASNFRCNCTDATGLFLSGDSETDKREQIKKVIRMSSQRVAYSPEELASFRTSFEDAIISPVMLTTSNRLQVV
jgi:hypothetical protein